MKKIGSRRHCLERREGEMTSVPGLSQVLTACELLRTSGLSAISVSIASSDRDEELIALSEEVADESGVRIECERRGRMLVLRFTRDRVR